MRCTNCGWQLTGDAIFCHHCGKSLSSNNCKRKENGNGMKTVVIILSVALVACITVSAILFLGLFSDNKKDNTSADGDNKPTYSENDMEDMTENADYETPPVEETKEMSSVAYDELDIMSYVEVEKASDKKYNFEDLESAGTYKIERDHYDLGKVSCGSILVTGFDEVESMTDYIKTTFSYSDDSAFYRISAAYNRGGITAASLCDEMKRMYPGEVTYNPVRDEWFAISTNYGDIYRYAYYRVNDQRIVGFEFHFYGEENLNMYSKYIDEIFASFEYDF